MIFLNFFYWNQRFDFLTLIDQGVGLLGKTHIKKGLTTKFLPSLHQWLSVPCHFFFSLIMAWNGFWQFFLFLPNFCAKTAGEKKKEIYIGSFHRSWSFFLFHFTMKMILSINPRDGKQWTNCQASIKKWLDFSISFDNNVNFSNMKKSNVLILRLFNDVDLIFS